MFPFNPISHNQGNMILYPSISGGFVYDWWYAVMSPYWDDTMCAFWSTAMNKLEGWYNETGRCFEFDGGVDTAKQKVNIGKAAVLANIYDGGGTVIFFTQILSDGETSAGRIYDKGFARMFTASESGGKVRLRLNVPFTGTDAEIITDIDFFVDDYYMFQICYNSDNLISEATLHAKNYTKGDTTFKEYSSSEGNAIWNTPTGTRNDDSGQDWIIGNKADGSRTYHGKIALWMIYDTILSEANRELAGKFLFSDMSTSPILDIPCQDTLCDEPSIITGTDSDMTGPNNWLDLNAVVFDINTSEPDALYISGGVATPVITYISKPALTGYNMITFKIKRVSGPVADIEIFNSNLVAFDLLATITPELLWLQYACLFDATYNTIVIGNTLGFNGTAFAITDVLIRPLKVTDISGNGNDGYIETINPEFFNLQDVYTNN